MKRAFYLLLTTCLTVLLVGWRSPGALYDTAWAELLQRPSAYVPWVCLSTLVGCWIALRLSKPRHAREYLYLALLSWLFLHILLGFGCGFYAAAEETSLLTNLIMGISQAVVYLFLSFFYFWLSLPNCLFSAYATWGASRLWRQYRVAHKR